MPGAGGAERSQRHHLGCALRAFVRVEYHRFTTGVSWFAATMGSIREAVRQSLANPVFVLPDGSTAELVAGSEPENSSV